MNAAFDERAVRAALQKAWSLETAVQWTPKTPAAGQCNVTAVIIQEMFGGDILRTRLEGFESHHYYNRIEGKRVDLTDSQFDSPIDYADELSDRNAAMDYVRDAEYQILRSRLSHHLAETSR